MESAETEAETEVTAATPRHSTVSESSSGAAEKTTLHAALYSVIGTLGEIVLSVKVLTLGLSSKGSVLPTNDDEEDVGTIAGSVAGSIGTSNNVHSAHAGAFTSPALASLAAEDLEQDENSEIFHPMVKPVPLLTRKKTSSFLHTLLQGISFSSSDGSFSAPPYTVPADAATVSAPQGNSTKGPVVPSRFPLVQMVLDGLRTQGI